MLQVFTLCSTHSAQKFEDKRLKCTSIYPSVTRAHTQIPGYRDWYRLYPITSLLQSLLSLSLSLFWNDWFMITESNILHAILHARGILALHNLSRSTSLCLRKTFPLISLSLAHLLYQEKKYGWPIFRQSGNLGGVSIFCPKKKKGGASIKQWEKKGRSVISQDENKTKHGIPLSILYD